MSSSSISSSSSSTISSFPSSHPSPATATSRMRRQRRNAISREADSEWEAPTTSPSPLPISTDSDSSDDQAGVPASPPPPRRDDELVYPLARSSSPSIPPPLALPLIAPTEEQVAELQAMLARFTFPSPTRKHRRSGQIIDHPGATTPNGASATSAGAVRRAPCAHC